MNPDQYKVLTDKMDSLQQSVDRLDKDLALDRSDLQRTEIRLGAVEDVLEAIRKITNNLPSRTQSRVEDALSPIQHDVQNLQATIQSKKTVIIKEKTKSLWRRILRK